MSSVKGVRGAAVCAVLLFAVAASGASFTSQQSGDWSSPATWGGSVPVTGDDVIITSNHVVTVSDARVINTVTLDSTAGSKMLVVQTGGTLLIERALPPALTISAPSAGNTNIVRIDGGTLETSNAGASITGGTTASKIEFTSLGGTARFATHVTFAGTNALIDFGNSAGVLEIGGDLGSGGAIVNTTSSTTIINGTGAQTINSYPFHHFTVNKAGGTATLNGPIQVNGNLTLTGGVLDDGGNQISLNGAATSTTFIGSMGVLKLGSAGSATSFPTPHGPVTLSGGSAVVYQAGVTQTIQSAFAYDRLYLATMGGTVNKILSGAALTVNGELNITKNGLNNVTLSLGTGTLDANADISGDGTVSMTSGAVTVAGNWSAAGTISAGTGTITFDGTGIQQVPGATYHNLEITKTGGSANLAGNATVITLTINSGTFNAGTNSITTSGHLLSYGTLAAPNATLVFNGTSPQVFLSDSSTVALNTLTVNNASGITADTLGLTINGALNLTNGKVTVQSGPLFVGVLAALNRTSGWIVGPLTMGMNPTPARSFPVGTVNAYLPVDVDAGSAGSLTIQAVEAQHPPRTGDNVLDRYWTISSGSVTPLDSITFYYNQADVTTGDETKYLLARYLAGYTRYGDANDAANTAGATNVSAYTGDWIIGQRGSVGAPGALAITSVNSGSNPNVNVAFDVAVKAVNDYGDPTVVTANTTVNLAVLTGTGNLGGTTSGTINAGTSSVTISGVVYDTQESGVVLRAARTAGDPVDFGDSSAFNVLAPPSSITVSSINDSGAGTLRQAILDANSAACSSPCTIGFSTSGTINLSTPLPPINVNDVTIDGFTAPGASANTNSFGQPSNAVLTVAIDGGGTVSTGIGIQAAFVNVKGLAIKNFANSGVVFSGTTTSSTLSGCYVGTDITGNVAQPSPTGVHFNGASFAVLGGFTAAARNVISGNSVWGVIVDSASSNIGLYGNYIGTKADLSAALANNTGVKIFNGTTNVAVGSASAGNVIAGNLLSGLVLEAGSVSVKANYVGLGGVSGIAIPNATGIQIDATSDANVIGGASPSEINYIGGNTQNGILINSDDNVIDNNVIGLSPDGVTARGNGGHGIRLENDAARNIIGTSFGNKIVFNTGDGVSIATSNNGIGNAVRKSKLAGNGSLAIDLGDDGSTANDPTDTDLGPNNKQNHPALSEAKSNAGFVNVKLALNSSGGVNANFYNFDVYKADGSGQAIEYLGNSGCQGGNVFPALAFSVPAGSTVVGNHVVATATAYSDAGCSTPSEGTSELSGTMRIGGEIHWIAGSGSWENAANWSPATVPTTGDDAFIDAAGTYTVTINSLPSIASLQLGNAAGTQTLQINSGQSLTVSSSSTVYASGILEHAGSTLGGSGALSVFGTMNWSAGQLIGVGGVTIESGATLNINSASAKTIFTSLLTVDTGATANWNGGAITLQNGGAIDNNALFEIKTDDSISDGGSGGTFDNIGTLRKSATAGATNFTGIALNHNGGTIDVQSGRLNLAGGTSFAAIAIASGADVYIDDNTYTFANGTSTTGAGKVHVTGGTLNVSGPSVSIERLLLDAGFLDGTGSAKAPSGGSWVWSGGTMKGSGSSIIQTGASFTIGTAANKILNGRTLTIQSGVNTTWAGTGAIQLSNGGNIANAGILTATDDAAIQNSGLAGGFTNSGTFRKNGTAGTTTFSSVALTNSGTVEVMTGTLNTSTVTNNGDVILTGTWLLDDSTVTLGLNSDVSGSGLLHVAGGTLTVDENEILPNVQLDGGTINGTGGFDISSFLWNGGTMSGSGTTNINTGDTATIATTSAKSLQRTFYVAPGATALVTGSGTINMSAGGVIGNAGLFDVQTDGTINDAGGDAGILNDGTFRKSGGSGSLNLSSVDFTNNGDLFVQSGTLNPSLIASIGNIIISTNCTLLVDDSSVTLTAGDVSGAGQLKISGGTVTANANDTFPNVRLDFGTLDGTGSIAITSLLWNGGTMSGAGTTTVPALGTATIAGASAKSLQRALSVVNTGTVNVTGSGAIDLSAGGNIANDGLFEITSSVSINDAGAAGDINNTRVFRTNIAAGNATLGVTLNNTGGSAAVDLVSGSLNLADGASSGAFTLGPSNSLLIDSHSYTFAAGTTVTGGGLVALSAGTLFVTGSVSVPNLLQTNGTVDGSGTLTLTGASTWTAGTMQGGGTTTVGSGGTLTLSGFSAKALNNRALSVAAGGGLDVTGGGVINLSNNAGITNAGTFTLTANNNFNDAGSGGNFTNSGTLIKMTATGPTNFVGVGFANNGGLVDLRSGTMSVTGDTFTQAAGSTLKFWLGGTTPGTGFSQLSTDTTPALAGTLELALTGPYQPAGGDTFRVISATTRAGDFTQPYTYPPLSSGRTFSDAWDASGLLITVSGSSDVSIDKSAPANVVAGAPIAYTLTVSNAGPDAASSVSVTDTLQTGHTSITASGTGWTCTVASLTVTCTAASLPTGAAPAITINANAPSTPQSFTNVANVSASNDSTPGNNSDSAAVTVGALQADLSLGGTAPAGPVAIGTPVTFQFNVTNHGPQQATNVAFTATLPSALTFNSATFGVTNCTFAAPTVSCSGGSMNASTFKAVTLNVTTNAAGTQSVQGNATATEADGTPSNNFVALTLGVSGSTITVTNTSDGGNGSLRQALLDAQSGVCAPLPCTIAFNIGVGPFVIAPQTNLPTVESQIFVDATTQPGYAGVPLIVIDGSAPATTAALTVNGNGSTVRGFSIQGDTHGIYVSGNGNSIEGNYLGLTPAGLAGPNAHGIRVTGNGNTIGGTTPAQRNVISGNGDGVFLTGGGDGNVISGNYIGTDPAGTAARPNMYGIVVYDLSDATVIGGATPAHRNVIAGNTNGGVNLTGTGSSHATNTVIRNNWIGVDAGGSTLLPNGTFGIHVMEVTDTSITENTIAGHANIGVIVNAGRGTTILNNSIYDNANFGIDLGGNAATPNDAGDADSGANGLQNFPTLNGVALAAGNAVTVYYSIDSSAATPAIGSLRISVYEADAGGDGKSLVGETCVADNAFTGNFTFTSAAVVAGDPIVATATSYSDAGCTTVADGTSEFSNVDTAGACTPPPVTITGAMSYCPGSPTVVLDAGAGFASYLWSTGAISRTITVTPAATTTYSVTVTTATGCTNSDSHTVTAGTTTSVTITGPTTTCAGSSVLLDAGPGHATYSWSTGATTQQITVSPGSTTSYSVNVFDAIGCMVTDDHTVTVTANPTSTITGPTDVCAGGTVTLDAGPGYSSYSWNTGATTQQISVSPASTTTYSVTVGNGSCSASDTHTVTVNAPPAATISSSGPTTFCAGGSVMLTASAGSSWLWNNGATTQSINVTSSGTFTVQVSDATCSATSAPVTVTVNPAPVINITGPSATCAAAPVTLDAGPGFASYAWSNGATTQQITVSPATTQTYSVTVTSGSGCSASDSHVVNVGTNPAATINAPTGLCENSSASASVAAQSGATYAWTVTNGSILSGQGTSSIAFAAGASGSVTLGVIVNAGSCTSSGNAVVPISPRPSAAITAPASATPAQSGLVASVPVTAGATYVWSVTNGALTAGQGTNSITFTAGESGTTGVFVTVSTGACSESNGHQLFIENGGPQLSDVSIAKSGPATVQPGGTIVYTLRVSNLGSVDASGVVVTDNFPIGTSFVSMNGGPWNCARMNAGIRCTGTALGNTSSNITLTLTAPQQLGSIVNTADVTSATPDANPSNNSSSVATSVVGAPPTCATAPPALTSPASGATAGSPVTFTWSAVTGATGYELWLNDTLVATTTSTTITRPVSSGAVTWFVVARLGTGCDPLTSATRTFTVTQSTDCATNAAPQFLAPANGSTVASPTTFVWSDVARAIGYRLWITVNGGAPQDAGTTDGATSLTIALPAGNVVANVEALFSSCSPVRSAAITVTVPKPDPCAARATATPVAPANNSVQSSSSVTFQWTAAAGASGYRVWISVDGGAPALLGHTTSETSLHAAIPRGEVIWWLEALYEGCASTESQPVRFTLPARNDCAQTRPELVAPARNTQMSSASVDFVWSAVPNAVSYELWASVDHGTESLLGTTTSTSLTRIVPPGRIDWFVRAIVDRCPSRDSQTFRLTHTPPANCAGNQRPTLVAPLDGAEGNAPLSFAWGAVANATSYDLYIVRDGVTSLLMTTTGTEANSGNLAGGALRWFVRANFGGGCSPLDSTERRLELVPAAAACSTLDAPAIAAPGQISSGVPFLIQWTPVNGATAYQLQLASNASFNGAQLVTTAGTSHSVVRNNAGNEPAALFARVRAVDGRCTPPSVSAYGAASAIFILPLSGTEASAPVGAASVQFTIPLGAELAGRTFVAVPKQPWLSVAPASGVVGPNGTTLTVTANASGLPVGTSLGGVTVSIASNNAGGIGTNNTVTIPSSFSVSMVTPVTPNPRDTPPPDSLIIPAVAHAGGINSQFQSDVRVSNTSAQVIEYLLTFTPSGDSGVTEGQQTQFTIEPGRTIALDDILKTWFGTGNGSAIGTLEIRPLTQTATSTSSSAFAGLANLVTFASSRTFNVTANGTFGQYIPAIPFANFVGRDRLLSLQQIAQSSRYRTNLGIVEGSGNPAALLVRVFGENGQYLTEFNVNLRGGQHLQLNSFLQREGISDLNDGRVEIEVLSGDGLVTAYASVLDNQTSDPLLVTPVTLGEGNATKWVMPGVADLVSGFANWQTDMRLFNAGQSAVEATLTFHSQGGGEPKVRTLTIPAGQVRQFDRTLASLFETTNDGGAVHITTAEPAKLIATARTYNQTGAGTYGQFISAITPAEAAGLESRPLQLLQVEESERFRSNVGLVEVSGKPVTIEISAVPPDAKISAVTELTLRPNEFRQLGSLLKSMGLDGTYNARVTVRVIEGEGRVTAYASVIDMQTNDPTYVPAQ